MIMLYKDNNLKIRSIKLYAETHYNEYIYIKFNYCSSSIIKNLDTKDDLCWIDEK